MGTLSKDHTENAINVTRGKNDDLFDNYEPQKLYSILVTSANLYGPYVYMGLCPPSPPPPLLGVSSTEHLYRN